MGHCYLRFCTAESRPGGEYLPKISGIFLNSNTSFKAHETGKNCPKFVVFGHFYNYCCYF